MWETYIYCLTDLGTVKRGRSRHRPRDDKSLYGGEYPFVQTGDVKSANFYLTNYSQTYNEKGLQQSNLWNKGTLCITIVANIAETAILGIEACFPDSIVGFTPYKNMADVRYIKYYFDIFKKQMQAMSQGATQDNFSVEKMLKVKFIIPLLPTQKKIANILSAYDDLIENNNRRIELLEQAAQQLYKEWFVRFRFPVYETVHFIKGIPDGFEVKKLNNIVEIIDGDRGVNYPNQNEMYDEGYCLFLNAGNVTTNGFDFSKNTFIAKEKDEKLRKGKLSREDIIITTRGTVGNVALYNRFVPFNHIRINSGMVIVRPISCDINTSFLYLLLRSSYVQQLITLFSSGSAQPQLPIKDMKNIKVLVPTQKLLSAFEEIVKPILEIISNKLTKNQNLIKQRDLLLPRLMSGKLEV